MSRAERAATLPGSRSERPERLDQPLRLVHYHPGYLRIQADAFSRPAEDSSVVAAAQTAAAALPGYRSWSQHPRTRSAVVQYDPEVIEADDLLQYIVKELGLRGVVHATSGTKRSRREVVGALLDAVQAGNEIVSQMTGERADLREVVPAALAVVSVVSFVIHERRGRLPRWNSALYHGYRIFMQWHRREVRAREKAARKEEKSGRSGTENTP
jgi:Heavy metal associated domain 2